jgi:hypothetical protein
MCLLLKVNEQDCKGASHGRDAIYGSLLKLQCTGNRKRTMETLPLCGFMVFLAAY